MFVEVRLWKTESTLANLRNKGLNMRLTYRITLRSEESFRKKTVLGRVPKAMILCLPTEGAGDSSQ